MILEEYNMHTIIIILFMIIILWYLGPIMKEQHKHMYSGPGKKGLNSA